MNELEKELEKVKKELADTIDKGKHNATKVVNLEIDNEDLQNENR